MEILYQDKRILVALKPPGVLSTNEPGGMPELLRRVLGDETACVRTVHRLDRVVGGVMVFARSAEAARRMSRQMERRQFQKTYLAVTHGCPAEPSGTFLDHLHRDKQKRMTYVVDAEGGETQEASLSYQLLAQAQGLSLLSVQLHTGRTHQIRAQLSHHGLPLAGDKKYGIEDDFEKIGLWSYRLGFYHPETEAWMEFSTPPREESPWTLFPGMS